MRGVEITEGVLEKGSLGSALGTSVAFKGAGGGGCMSLTYSLGGEALMEPLEELDLCLTHDEGRN